MAATAEQIAQRVGCSPATVSRVLNGTGPVSEQTQKAVLKAIRAVGGLPTRRRRGQRVADATTNSNSRVLESGLIEIVMHLIAPVEHMEVRGGEIHLGPIAACPPDRFFRPENRYTNTTFRRISDGCVDESTRWRMRPVLRTVSGLEDPQLLADLGRSDVQGLIILGNDSPAVDQFLRRCQCPIVSLIGMGRNHWPCASSDDLPGMRQAVAHLANLGHRRIGYVACPSRFPGFAERLVAFRLAMTEAGCELRNQWIYDESVHIADITLGMERILSQPDRPTAVICSYDGAAVGVMRAAAKIGLKVPHDLSVIGFGNQDIADLTRPALTSVDVPTYEMGRAAVKLLMMQRMQPDGGSIEGMSVRLPTHLVERASTGPAPQQETIQVSSNTSIHS